MMMMVIVRYAIVLLLWEPRSRFFALNIWWIIPNTLKSLGLVRQNAHHRYRLCVYYIRYGVPCVDMNVYSPVAIDANAVRARNLIYTSPEDIVSPFNEHTRTHTHMLCEQCLLSAGSLSTYTACTYEETYIYLKCPEEHDINTNTRVHFMQICT